jgi:hypothetical protein
MGALVPDEDRDVIVHAFTVIDALTGEPLGDRWSVWLGRDSEGAFETIPHPRLIQPAGPLAALAARRI